MGKKNSDKPVVGVDLGGTKILAGVVDVEGKILPFERPTRSDTTPRPL